MKNIRVRPVSGATGKDPDEKSEHVSRNNLMMGGLNGEPTDDEEKFNNLQLAKAQEIIDRAGPAAFYWMSDIAAQLALLCAAQINGIPTNVKVELGASATAGDVVRVVVK